VLAFVPPEERVKYSALTGQALYYLGGDANLKHKILAIVEEEGAERASYALKLLQSEGELSIASTGKDPHTGRMVTQECPRLRRLARRVSRLAARAQLLRGDGAQPRALRRRVCEVVRGARADAPVRGDEAAPGASCST
jgi:hypothetical protein